MFTLCLLVLLASGPLFWQAWFASSVPIWLQRIAVLAHAVSAFVLILAVIVHAYAALWVKGTLGAMVRGRVSVGWARNTTTRCGTASRCSSKRPSAQAGVFPIVGPPGLLRSGAHCQRLF